MVNALDLKAEGCGFKSRCDREHFQTISTPSSYSTCPGLIIKGTCWHLVTDSAPSVYYISEIIQYKLNWIMS